MAKKSKKGPRQPVGLKCTECGAFGYITEFNKNNEQLLKQKGEKTTFPLNKYCKVCRAHKPHNLAKKLK